MDPAASGLRRGLPLAPPRARFAGRRELHASSDEFQPPEPKEWGFLTDWRDMSAVITFGQAVVVPLTDICRTPSSR